MKMDWSVKLLLLVIAIATATIALRPYLAPPPVQAQNNGPYPFYIEPGTVMLRAPDGSRSVLGRVVIDMRNGNVWGFPTTTPDTYPSDRVSRNPPTSRPFLLGTFAFSDVDRANR
jgi:hypothetical protein